VACKPTGALPPHFTPHTVGPLPCPTISRRIADGEIHSVKVGNRHRIPYTEVRRVWLEPMTAMADTVAPDLEAELFGDD
jgi:excisionase family DNA binding protein